MLKIGGDIITERSVIEGEVVTEVTPVAGEIHFGGGETYRGEYTFTPSAQTQTIEIAGKTARENIIINPVPSNYGLITWNGSTITVS